MGVAVMTLGCGYGLNWWGGCEAHSHLHFECEAHSQLHSECEAHSHLHSRYEAHSHLHSKCEAHLNQWLYVDQMGYFPEDQHYVEHIFLKY